MRDALDRARHPRFGQAGAAPAVVRRVSSRHGAYTEAPPALRTPSAASFRAFITGTRRWLVFGRAALHSSGLLVRWLRWQERAARCVAPRHA